MRWIRLLGRRINRRKLATKPAIIEIMNQVRCKIHRMPDTAKKAIDEALSYDLPRKHFNTAVREGLFDGKKHLFYKETCTFPKGLLPRVKKLMREGGWGFKVWDNRKGLLPKLPSSSVQPDLGGGITLRPYQLEAARASLEMESGILWMATNAGKTEIASALIKQFLEAGHRVLFIVHKRVLLSQTRERFAERLGIITEHIGRVGGGFYEFDKPLTVGIQSSLMKRGKNDQRWTQKHKFLKSVNVLFIDEGHHTQATTWYNLVKMIPAQWRYILSGTPFASAHPLMVEAATGPVIARIKNKELIELGVSAKPLIEIVEIDKPQIPGGKLRDWHEVYKEGIVLNEHRNREIAKRAIASAKAEKPCLVIVTELWHGRVLRKEIEAGGVAAEFVHGKMPVSVVDRQKAKFEAGHFRVLIASPIFDEGVDVPAIRTLIIADGGKSPRAVLQKIGRGLRAKVGVNAVDVVDFADLTHEWLSDHSLERIEIYEEEDFEFKE